MPACIRERGENGSYEYLAQLGHMRLMREHGALSSNLVQQNGHSMTSAVPLGIWWYEILLPSLSECECDIAGGTQTEVTIKLAMRLLFTRHYKLPSIAGYTRTFTEQRSAALLQRQCFTANTRNKSHWIQTRHQSRPYVLRLATRLDPSFS